MKDRLLNMLKKIISGIFSCLPLRNVILFESIPDLSDNTKPVFDEMIKRGIHKRYKCIWIVSSVTKDLPVIENVAYCGKDERFFRLKLFYYQRIARALVCCNLFLPSVRKGQKSFYLTHGTCIKSVRNYYNVPDNMDFVLVDGEGTRAVAAEQFNYDLERTLALGYPRNDIFVQPPQDIHAFFPEHQGDKICVWYPTFRQHKIGHLNAAAKALPILHDEAQARKLNELAKENHVHLVLKPHFAQDVSKIKACNLSHIQFIDDAFFVEHQISSYGFLAGCDALLSDYSSVYYDYLLCDKPIGLIWEDYEEYRQTTNFAVDMDYYMKAGEKIYNMDDFARFLRNLAKGEDSLQAARAEISAWANFARDGKSAVRVTDFILQQMQEKTGMN